MTSEDLRHKIRALRCKNNETQKFFVPDGALDDCFDDAVAGKILENHQLEPFQIKTAVDAIVNGGRKVFAILVTIRRAENIVHFIANDHLQGHRLDSRLPFFKDSLQSFVPDVAEEFYEEQWHFTAPILSRQFHHRNLDVETILPYLQSKFRGEGAFGKVHEVTIHSSHQRLGFQQRNRVGQALMSHAYAH